MGELNSRTPEEIKAGLRACTTGKTPGYGCNAHCPYLNVPNCWLPVKADALALIEYLEARIPEWISVEERLPENEECVLITALYDRYYGKPYRTVMTAFHTNGKLPAGQSLYNWEEGSVEMQYDEEADDFIVPEGWWEDVQCGDEFSMVCAKVTHWMPLPETPEEGEHEAE